MVAARKGSVGIIRKLIHHGANVNLTNEVTMETNFLVSIIHGRSWYVLRIEVA